MSRDFTWEHPREPLRDKSNVSAPGGDINVSPTPTQVEHSRQLGSVPENVARELGHDRDMTMPRRTRGETRAMENQIFLMSLNRAGEQYGNSLFCWPWMDENKGPVAFPQHEEALKHIVLERSVLNQARTDYSFLRDRLEDYDRLPTLT